MGAAVVAPTRRLAHATGGVFASMEARPALLLGMAGPPCRGTDDVEEPVSTPGRAGSRRAWRRPAPAAGRVPHA